MWLYMWLQKLVLLLGGFLGTPCTIQHLDLGALGLHCPLTAVLAGASTIWHGW